MIHLHQIDQVAFAIGPVRVHWYGLMYLLAFASAWWLGSRRIREGRLPVDANACGDLLCYGMIGVVLGGRLGSILFYDLGGYLADPVRMLKLWEGGMSFHGGLLGVLAATWYWARRQGLHLFDVLDFIAPWVPPGLGLGRIGNYIGAELWGKYTQAGWGVVFPTDPRFAGWSAEQLQAQFATGALDAFARHPSQLYQAFLEGLVMFAVLWCYSSK